MNLLDAFDSGLLSYREIMKLCEDVIHELNARGVTVSVTGLNKEHELNARGVTVSVTGLNEEHEQDVTFGGLPKKRGHHNGLSNFGR
jgi:hypothetical protein